MAYQDYLKMTSRQRRKLALNAKRGNIEAQKQLTQYTREIKAEVNKRLRELEKSNLDYGKAYNNLLFFTQTEYGSNRFQSVSKLDNDWYAMSLQNDIGYKFLNTMTSTKEGARTAERHRMDRLKELEIIPEDIAPRREKEFLRFLGNEEISAAIDEYGTSDVIVEMFYDAYKVQGTQALNILKTSMNEWLANRISFDDAMLRTGIKIEDYISRKPTS